MLSTRISLAEATDHAERFRPVLDKFAALPAGAVATTLNARNVPSPRGGKWCAAHVIRLRKRLAEGPGIAPRSVELCEAGAAVNDVKRPSRFGQQRGGSFPFRSEQ